MSLGTTQAKEQGISRLRTVAIQGEPGSNSHMMALEMLGDVEVVPCSISAEVIAALVDGRVDGAVLPIENSLHGSVHEHYDLMLANPVRIDSEGQLRIRHNLMVVPGVKLDEIRTVYSHPVALAQCRKYLATMTHARAVPFYDTAGSVKHVMAEGLRDVAGVAPALAAEIYGAEILVPGIEDHEDNYTRFHLLRRASDPKPGSLPAPNKLSVAFAVEHQPGTLVAALQGLAAAGVNLMKIESRPVPGRPWEYIFYVDFRFDDESTADAALAALKPVCSMVKELGRYAAA
ncbi:prephenate dehydratase [Bryocella elongata]|uniref:prephenate dehydratase n=1 Tax=Bryocella elongata TaxID=863522 RepID=A0A1H5W2F6_9BACT|nr:prephenate dehydratase [Bryocella elongata]SEF93321.1 prephenate dehydratase [Bryocella elongata]